MHLPKVSEKTKSLLLAIKNGDEIAFAKLTAEYMAFAKQYALDLTGDKDLAPHIAYQAFLKLWADRKQIQSSMLVRLYLVQVIFSIGKRALQRTTA